MDLSLLGNGYASHYSTLHRLQDLAEKAGTEHQVLAGVQEMKISFSLLKH
jgi:hypothetical protein